MIKIKVNGWIEYRDDNKTKIVCPFYIAPTQVIRNR